MPITRAPLHEFVMRFAEVIDELGRRLHVGCIMAAGQDWVELSVPEPASLEGHLQVRFLPAETAHEVEPGWRSDDCVGFTNVGDGPPEDQFAGLPGLLDPRPTALKRRG